ncbi:unnamed protein product [Urochloa humidicola]
MSPCAYGITVSAPSGSKIVPEDEEQCTRTSGAHGLMTLLEKLSGRHESSGSVLLLTPILTDMLEAASRWQTLCLESPNETWHVSMSPIWNIYYHIQKCL